MSYLALDSLQPRTFIYASNAEALVLQSTTNETKLAFINANGSNQLDPIYYVSSSNDNLQITRNNSNIATFFYADDVQEGRVTVRGPIAATKNTFLQDSSRQIVFKDFGVNEQFAGIGYTGGAVNFQIPSIASYYSWNVASGITNIPLVFLGYDAVSGQPRLGIGTTIPTESLDVNGNIFVSGTTVTSNLHVLGDTVILNTITSNTEEMIITNSGPGPALSVNQFGDDMVLEVLNNSNMVFAIRQGNVGIGTTYPRLPLDVIGNQIISGNLGIGTLLPTRRLHVYGDMELSGTLLKNGVPFRDILSEWQFDPSTSNLTYTQGNVGIGNTTPTKPLSVTGDIETSGQLISTVTSIPPFQVQSIERVDNLNVQYLDGKDSTFYMNFANFGRTTLYPFQGGTGSNNLTLNKLLVGQGPSNSVLTPPELHWDNQNKRLGISQVAPQERLHVEGNLLAQSSNTVSISLKSLTNQQTSYLLQSGSSQGALDMTSSNFRIWGYQQQDILFGTRNIERIRILSTGNVGIGTSSPVATLQVVGTQSVLGNVGIGTTNPQVILELHSTNALLLPRGSNVSRPTGVLGYIRYNTETSQFEGFGAGNQWGSLGGVKSVTGDTYILAEYSPGNNDQTLHLYTAGQENLTVDSRGNVGIGSTAPTLKLVIASTDAVQLPRGTTAQRPPGGAGYIRYNTQTSQFEGFGAGSQWGSLGGVKSVAGDTYILAEYSPGNNDQSLHFYTAGNENMILNNNGNLGIGTTIPTQKLDVVGNIAATGTITASSFLGTATRVSNDLIRGSYLTGTNYNGLSPTTWAVDADINNSANKVVVRDASGNFSAGTITATLSGTATKVSNDLVIGSYLTGTNYNGISSTTWAVDATTTATGNKIVARDSFGNIYAANIGIGTTSVRQLLDVEGGNAIISGNVGIGTTIPLAAVHISSLSGAQILIDADRNNTAAESATASLVLKQDGGISAGTIGFTEASGTNDLVMAVASSTAPKLYFNTANANGSSIDLYNTGYTKMTIDNPGNVGIGTTLPRQKLHVIGDALYTGIVTATTFSGVATQVSSNLVVGSYLTGANYNGSVSTTWAVDAATTATGNKVVARDVFGNIYVANIGIGTTSARQLLDILGGNAIISGNLGVGTTLPIQSLHIVGASYFTTNVGIGTTNGRQLLDIQGGDAIVSGNIGIGTTQSISNVKLYVAGNQYVSANIGIGTTITRQKLDIQGGNAIISGNIGIGTISPIQQLHVVGTTYLNGNLGVGTIFPRASIDIDTNTALVGNLGIGTTIPRQRLDVNGYAIASRLGIGTTSPREALDTIGNALFNSGNVGINTTTAYYSLQIHSADSVLTSEGGKLGISKGVGILPSTDLEIVNSANDAYTGVLLRNNGNVYPSASLRIQAHRWDADTNQAYAAAIGLARYNNNSYQRNGVPLGAIHFGGNHTNGTTDNINYASSIQGVAEADFTNSSNVNVGLVFYTGSNGYKYPDTTATNRGNEQMRITSTGRVGIRTSQPRSEFEVNGNAIVTNNLIVGANLTTSNLIVIGDSTILNTVTSNTEQLVINNAGTGPALKVFQSGIQPVAEFYDVETGLALCITDTGKVGINSSSPANRLDVGGNTYISGTLTINNTLTTNDNSINAGLGSVTAANFLGTATKVSNDLMIGGYLTGNNYNGSISTTWAVDATTTATANKIVARDGFGNIYTANVGIGTTFARQKLDIQGGNAIVSGNIGIGTISPVQPLHVQGTTYMNGSLGLGTSNPQRMFHVQGTNAIWRLDRDAQTPSLQIHQFPPGDFTTPWKGYLIGVRAFGTNDGYFFINDYGTATSGNSTTRFVIDTVGNIGIATANPSHKLHIYSSSCNDNDYESTGILLDNATAGEVGIAFRNSNVSAAGNVWVMGLNSNSTRFNIGYGQQTNQIVDSNVNLCIDTNGNIGIGTTIPLQKIHVLGNAYISGTINGTITGTATQVSNDLVIGSYLTGANYNGSVTTTWSVDATTAATAGKVVARDAGGTIFAANVGIGTTFTRQKLDVVGNVMITNGNVGIGTTTINDGVNIYKNTSIGTGLLGTSNLFTGGPFWKQKGWDIVGTTHMIQYPEYCISDNSSGNLQIQVKSITNDKIGNISLSFLKQVGVNVDIFSIYYHKTDNMTTFTVAASTSNILVTTDSDCAIAWTSMGAC